MGRITVFTGEDLLSLKARAMLEARQLPFVEINVVEYPSAAKHLRLNPSVPQVFFNDRCVGGVAELEEELQRWRADTRYSSERQKYQAEIASGADVRLLRLDMGPPAPKVRRPREPSATVPLLDGTRTAHFDITEKLKQSLPMLDLEHKGTIYKRSFTGSAAIDTFCDSLDVDDPEGKKFLQTLIDGGVIQPLGEDKEFPDMETRLYRLQCHATPSVLNSYRVWDKIPSADAMQVVASLDVLLSHIELRSFNSKDGKLSYYKAIHDNLYPEFEECVCELQKVDMTNMMNAEKLAFGLNVYRLMMRYAFIKLGICEKEDDKTEFMETTMFNIGGDLYSFQEWMDGILRGNSKSRFASKPPFGGNDARRKFAVEKLDPRVHFAANASEYMGASASLPFKRFSVDAIDEELDTALKVYCSDPSFVNTEGNQTMLANMFSFYRHDFKQCEELKGIPILCEVLRRWGDAKVRYFGVDWTRNATNYEVYVKEMGLAEVKPHRSLMGRFQPARLPENESVRLATLHGLNLLDSLPEERYDRITRMVRDEFDVPMVFVSLIDKDRQWFKSSQWMCELPKPAETPREISFCGHTILGQEQDVFYVENALEDDRFADNPVVSGGLGIRFYAGAPLTVPSSHQEAPLVNIGSLCVLDVQPHTFTESQKERLKEYASQVKAEILRRDSEESDPLKEHVVDGW